MAHTPDDQRQPELVLALDFGGTKIAAGVANRDGELLSSERIATRAEDGAEQALERAIELAEQLVAERDARCLAVGAVSPGVMRAEGVLLCPNLPGWDRLPFERRLRERLAPTPVRVGNDVNAGALAESRWGALAGSDVALFVNLGTGIKAGIVVGGRIFSGAHGAAGEIGYGLRDPADAASFASGHAPLEEFVGGRGLAERAAALLGDELTAAELFARPDPPAGFLDEWLAVLTMHIANLAIAIDPDRIALGGGLMAHADLILPALRERIDAAVPFPPEVVAARFLHDGALRGAVALALDQLEVSPAEVVR